MDKILTISVAAYNVEEYLDQLIRSVVSSAQKKQIEILIVNDGSKDATLSISKDYENKYPDIIRVIDKENGGHGSTINQGIIQAQGKYFRALDGDDWVDTNGLDCLLQNLLHMEADLVINDYIECYAGGKKIRKEFQNIIPSKVYSSEEILSQIEWLPYHAVIYKTDLLKKAGISLDEHCFYVDAEYMAFPMPYISTVVYYNSPVYCYRLGEMGQSVSALSRMKHVNDSRRVAYRMMEFFSHRKNENSSALNEYLLKGVKRSCLWHFNTLLLFSPKKSFRNELRQYDKYIEKECPEVYSQLEQYPKIHMARKTFYFSYYSEFFMNLLRNVKNRIKFRK